ncbi:hypothetical protein T05_16409 [Trichinella murrelli]|uniref:Uncharacterized protein n=1 Tax=Trichinella murrelli TaxID=144512 RepID=A0A0V0SSC7_9BILA|nr:hypothetical protein T05_16409 [Trichinella murrelli]
MQNQHLEDADYANLPNCSDIYIMCIPKRHPVIGHPLLPKILK